jgi:exosortase/archaeosortase family protein
MQAFSENVTARTGFRLIWTHLAAGRRWSLVSWIALCGWPVWRWFATRLLAHSDEPWGLLALAAALAVLPRGHWSAGVSKKRILGSAAACAVYAAGYVWWPPVVRALWLVTALGFLLVDSREGLPSVALLGLSLPVMATAQFFLGYPLRVVATQIAAEILRWGGLSIRVEGTSLCWAGERVVVDAPCSGLHMMWTGMVAASVVAGLRRCGAGRTLLYLVGAVGAVMAANVLRLDGLFCAETGLWPNPAWLHAGIGCATQGIAVALILAFAPKPKLGSGWAGLREGVQ